MGSSGAAERGAWVAAGHFRSGSGFRIGAGNMLPDSLPTVADPWTGVAAQEEEDHQRALVFLEAEEDPWNRRLRSFHDLVWVDPHVVVGTWVVVGPRIRGPKPNAVEDGLPAATLVDSREAGLPVVHRRVDIVGVVHNIHPEEGLPCLLSFVCSHDPRPT